MIREFIVLSLFCTVEFTHKNQFRWRSLTTFTEHIFHKTFSIKAGMLHTLKKRNEMCIYKDCHADFLEG